MKKIVLYSGALVILVGGSLFLYIYNKPHPSTDKASYSLLSEDLIREFEEDESSSGVRYIDQILEVRGPVREVIERDNTFILLLGSDSSLGHVSCTLSEDADSIVYGLQPGDNVIVKGICKGFLMDVIMVNCQVIYNP